MLDNLIVVSCVGERAYLATGVCSSPWHLVAHRGATLTGPARGTAIVRKLFLPSTYSPVHRQVRHKPDIVDGIHLESSHIPISIRGHRARARLQVSALFDGR